MRGKASKRFRIGELAAEVGVSPKTIRYYEQIGLLPVGERTASGYRVYGPPDQVRLRFIAKAKAVGLTLKEIREILDLKRSGERPCEHVLEMLDKKLADVDAQMGALEDYRAELVAMRGEASDSATAEARVCGIIEHHVMSGRGGGAAVRLLSRGPQRRR